MHTAGNSSAPLVGLAELLTNGTYYFRKQQLSESCL